MNECHIYIYIFIFINIYIFFFIVTNEIYFSGKHILAELEKYFMKNAPDTMGSNMASPL